MPLELLQRTVDVFLKDALKEILIKKMLECSFA